MFIEEFFMAHSMKKTPLNVSGPYYVDCNCICCGICTLIAPLNLFVNLNDEYGYVGKQPENKDEIRAVEKAIQNCPVDAIGNDGEKLKTEEERDESKR
jgi:ferredoxin